MQAGKASRQIREQIDAFIMINYPVGKCEDALNTGGEAGSKKSITRMPQRLRSRLFIR